MKMAARLLLAGALAASTFAVATPASACEDPRKGCGGCYRNPHFLEGDDLRPILCYN